MDISEDEIPWLYVHISKILNFKLYRRKSDFKVILISVLTVVGVHFPQISPNFGILSRKVCGDTMIIRTTATVPSIFPQWKNTSYSHLSQNWLIIEEHRLLMCFMLTHPLPSLTCSMIMRRFANRRESKHWARALNLKDQSLQLWTVRRTISKQ